ncbi:CP2G1 protein, partial [Piaya cayana]|nr:CP2G1 protein [Piaya cayana]
FLSLLLILSPLFPPSQLLFIFPSLMRLLPGPHRRIHSNYLQLADFVAEQVRRHRDTLDPQNPRDFIDCFLLKMQQESGNPATHFTEETLSKTAVNLFFAGTETVSSSLKYGLRILLRHPEVEGACVGQRGWSRLQFGERES